MLLNFHAGKFDEAIEFANRIPSRYRHLKFDIINTKLKILYERQDYYPALDLIRSYQNSLTKTELVPLHSRNSHKNLLSVLKMLIQIQLGRKNPDKKLINELREKSKYVYSNWLTQKIDEAMRKLSETCT
jgi:hypothetical protein